MSAQRITEVVTPTLLVPTMTEVSPVAVTQDTLEMESPAPVSEIYSNLCHMSAYSYFPAVTWLHLWRYLVEFSCIQSSFMNL